MIFLVTMTLPCGWKREREREREKRERERERKKKIMYS